jgi:hypothetical protein
MATLILLVTLVSTTGKHEYLRIPLLADQCQWVAEELNNVARNGAPMANGLRVSAATCVKES